MIFKRRSKKRLVLLPAVWIALTVFTADLAAAWGTVMYARYDAEIRAKRSTASGLKGRLKAGEPVKVDFFRNSWYAVFNVAEKRRSLKRALGYVHKSALLPEPPSDVSRPSSDGGKPARTASPKEKIEKNEQPVEIKNITFRTAEDGKELIFIQFNRFNTPKLFGIQGKSPRIVLDITNTFSLKKDWATINTGGRLIRKIRSHLNRKTHKARIVLDMNPSMDYYVNPIYYEKENIYCLEIYSEMHANPPERSVPTSPSR